MGAKFSPLVRRAVSESVRLHSEVKYVVVGFVGLRQASRFFTMLAMGVSVGDHHKGVVRPSENLLLLFRSPRGLGVESCYLVV